MLEWPARNDTKSDFGAFECDYETLWGLADFFLQVLKKLSGVGDLFNIDSLSFSLEYAVLVHEDEAH